MTRNAITVGASAATVFSVLVDPRAYDDLLPGARRVRRFDEGWPCAGSALHQTVGLGPLALPAAVEVVEVDEPFVLRLRARMMPLCVHRIDFLLRTEDGGTYVLVEAWPLSGPTSKVWNPLLDQLAWSRSEELLRRLRGMVEHRRQPLGV
jgi:hypothetical protein